MADLELYNTRTRSKEPLKTLEEGKVGIYTCGPTVYAAQHIGNMRQYLFADLLNRALEYEGFEVTQIINITDVGHLTDDASEGDDKMEEAAKKSGRSALDIAREYEAQWITDRERLGCVEPDRLCRATEHIPEQIEHLQAIEAGGYTYRIDDGIYFDTSKFPRYGDFARLKLDAQEEGSRIGEVEGKRNPADFALWKFASPDVKRQQEWDSPWGRGFPGWHLECSAMSSKYLGETFDIHTGGIDHIAVHHTNEIAQAETAFGVEPWVNVWMHGAFLVFDKEKMSKSKGKTILIDDLIERGYEPLAFRYFFLQAHYRQPQTFNDEAMQAAATGYRRLLGIAIGLRNASGILREDKMAPYLERFHAAIRDDLNAPRALAVTWDAAKADELTEAERLALLMQFDEVLGLDFENGRLATPKTESDPRIDELVMKRDAARKSRDFAESDRIRDELAGEGIVLVDGADGTTWQRK